MMFYIVPLTDEDILAGKLTGTSNALNNASIESAKRAVSEGRHKSIKELVVYFDNSSTNKNFNTELGDDVVNVLYFNPEAKLIVESSGMELLVKGETETIPNNLGVMCNLPYYENF